MAAPLSRRKQVALLQGGELTPREQINVSYNGVFLVDLCKDGEECLAVYKPRDGENPLWDFPEGTLHKREYLAYRVAQALGWEFVPPTVLREGPYGVGSVQLFIEADPKRNYFNLLKEHKAALVRMALFDCITNNADRKGGHVLLDGKGAIWGIDHGLCFSSERKMRTVMWDLREEAVPSDVRKAVRRVAGDAALRAELVEHLMKPEVEMFYRRVELACSAPTLQMERFADLRRPYPWPAI